MQGGITQPDDMISNLATYLLGEIVENLHHADFFSTRLVNKRFKKVLKEILDNDEARRNVFLKLHRDNHLEFEILRLISDENQAFIKDVYRKLIIEYFPYLQTTRPQLVENVPYAAFIRELGKCDQYPVILKLTEGFGKLNADTAEGKEFYRWLMNFVLNITNDLRTVNQNDMGIHARFGLLISSLEEYLNDRLNEMPLPDKVDGNFVSKILGEDSTVFDLNQFLIEFGKAIFHSVQDGLMDEMIIKENISQMHIKDYIQAVCLDHNSLNSGFFDIIEHMNSEELELTLETLNCIYIYLIDYNELAPIQKQILDKFKLDPEQQKNILKTMRSRFGVQFDDVKAVKHAQHNFSSYKEFSEYILNNMTSYYLDDLMRTLKNEIEKRQRGITPQFQNARMTDSGEPGSRKDESEDLDVNASSKCRRLSQS